MKIVVNHLTRMQPGYICVAGIDLEKNTHIRPVLPRARLTVDLLKRKKGPFDIAVVVDLGTVQPKGHRPEVEDHVFDPAHTKTEEEFSGDKFWKLLKSVSQANLIEIFGKQLEKHSNGCAVDEAKGSASLGCLLPAISPRVFINSWGKVRAQVSDEKFNIDLSVTDLRLYKDDQKTPRSDLVENVNRRIGSGTGVILSVGLARAFQAKGDTVRRHWLQVNNFHLENNPVW